MKARCSVCAGGLGLCVSCASARRVDEFRAERGDADAAARAAWSEAAEFRAHRAQHQQDPTPPEDTFTELLDRMWVL